jgi:hypothetical protein
MTTLEPTATRHGSAPARHRTRPEEPARPWWAQALAIFAASRVVTTLLFVWVGSQATSQSRAGAHPTLLGLSTAWDATWYWYIAVNGYPSTLPLTASGQVDTNQWAFLPVYPYVVKALSLGNTGAWPAAALVVSLACAAGAALLLGVLLRRRLDRSQTLFAVAVFSVSPLSFLFQTGYAESMGLLLLLGALCLLDRQRYLAAIPVAVLLAFTRPGALALSLTVGVGIVARLLRSRRGTDVVPPSQIVGAAVFCVVTVVAGLAWPVIVGLVTGVPDAYFATEAAWRRLWMSDTTIQYFTPWLFAAKFWFQGAGAVILAEIIIAFGLLLFVPAVRRLGGLIRVWSGSYALYLLAAFFPQSSIFRLLMPLAPLAGALAVPRHPAYRAAVLAGCIALQALWLWCTYGPFQLYWSVP